MNGVLRNTTLVEIMSKDFYLDLSWYVWQFQNIATILEGTMADRKGCCFLVRKAHEKIGDDVIMFQKVA